MPDNNLDLFIAKFVGRAVDGNRPGHQPSFESLRARWRRRRAVRRSSAVAAVALVTAAIAVPAVLVDRAGDRTPAPPGASAVPSRPVGVIPWEVTGVTACGGSECRDVTDAHQVRLIVDDLNAGEPYEGSGMCGPNAFVISLVFTGPRQPYPIIDLVYTCGWWQVRGQPQRYDGSGRIRDSAVQAQRMGIVVHDCRVTSPFNGPESAAPDFLELTLDEARSLAAQRGMSVRVLGEDGTCSPGPITDDSRMNRVNLYLQGGRVLTASLG